MRKCSECEHHKIINNNIQCHCPLPYGVLAPISRLVVDNLADECEAYQSKHYYPVK